MQKWVNRVCNIDHIGSVFFITMFIILSQTGKYKRKTSSSRAENDMQSSIKAFREGRSQCLAAELFLAPHSCLQRCLRADQDKPLKIKTAEQD